MERERSVGADIGEHGGLAEGHGESVRGSMTAHEVIESVLRELLFLGSRAVQLLRWVSKRLVKYCQHLSPSLSLSN